MKGKIGILGSGLVGSLISILLAKRGYEVEVFEKRSDPRKQTASEGRSINLALSHRGIRTLKMAGAFERVKPLLIPMYGRKVHTENGLDFQSYGRSDQYINSVSRHLLNTQLIDQAATTGATFHFEENVEAVDPEAATINLSSNKPYTFDYLIGADGAFSLLRNIMGKIDDTYVTEMETLTHSYKELTIPSVNGEFAMDPNALHIWPRTNYMLIALPNTDHSFTCTLFLSDQGKPSFERLNSSKEINQFLNDSFPDAVSLMVDPVEQFLTNPTSSLQTIRTYPWVYKNSMLIGDAAHAIVPFYGQGMNAGFEDCRLFVELLEANNHDWALTAEKFQLTRKKDADAIAELALNNFLEMRAHVINENFLKRKTLEKRLNEAFPEDWLPLYSMVTFSDLPYHQALELEELQKQAIQKLGKNYDPYKVDLSPVLAEFKRLKKALH